jgi:tetratricopeptide (TPR) repeat protein
MLPSLARADDAAVAREHYKKGTRLYELGKFGDAAAEYEQAYQAKDEPALLFNIGQAYRFDGQNKKALLAYKQYLRKVPNASNRADVEGHISALEKLIEDQKRSSSSPPTDTLTPPGHETAEGAPALGKAPPSVVAQPAAAPHTPAYKKWWVWTLVGVGVAAVAVGVGVGVSQSGTPERTLPPIGGP